MRTRRAHFRITDASGRLWCLTWDPATSLLHARRHGSRTTFAVCTNDLLTLIQLRGTVHGKSLRPDVAQLAFA